MTKTRIKKSKTKPKPTIASLQKEIRSLKRIISGQRQVMSYLERQCSVFFAMCETADSELASIRTAGNAKSKKGK
jgi:predicted RNase H-like nuclease (RuvC/YqgF family)